MLKAAGVLLLLPLVALAGLFAYPYVRAETYFLSQGRQLSAPTTLEAARQVEEETDAVLRVLPSGEWLLGNVVTIHMEAGYDAIIICASDGTTYTSHDHMCPGQGELQVFLRSLEGEDLDEIRAAIEANEYYSFAEHSR